METKGKRLKRLEGSSNEAHLTLLNSQGWFFVDKELKPAAKKKFHNLLILGIHSVAETWSEIIFGDSSSNGFKLYLEYFVDGTNPDQKFSKIAGQINTWRNVIAHQWLSSKGYSFGIDIEMQEGWKKEEGIIYFNPLVYFKCFCEGFDNTLNIIYKISTEDQREQMKQRIIDKFKKW